MSNVLIRNLPTDDLELLRSAAGERGLSLQAYLLETVRAQAAYVRRQEALGVAARRLEEMPQVPEGERAAVLDAVDAAQERVDRLSDASRR